MGEVEAQLSDREGDARGRLPSHRRDGVGEQSRGKLLLLNVLCYPFLADDRMAVDKQLPNAPLNIAGASWEVAEILFGGDAFVELKGQRIVRPGIVGIVNSFIHHGWTRMLKKVRCQMKNRTKLRDEADSAWRGKQSSLNI